MADSCIKKLSANEKCNGVGFLTVYYWQIGHCVTTLASVLDLDTISKYTTIIFNFLFKYYLVLFIYKAVIHLQFWAYGPWDSLFPISMNPTANI